MIDISKAQQIDGWMWNPDLLWLGFQASIHTDILEIGPFLGRTTRVLADNTPGGVCVCDNWDPEMYRNSDTDLFRMYPHAELHFNANLKDHLESNKVIKVNRFHLMNESLGSFNMVFIDGDHQYNAVIDDIKLARRLIKQGLICGHDLGREWKDVERAVRDEFGDSFKTYGSSLWWVEI